MAREVWVVENLENLTQAAPMPWVTYMNRPFAQALADHLSKQFGRAFRVVRYVPEPEDEK